MAARVKKGEEVEFFKYSHTEEQHHLGFGPENEHY